MWAVRLHLRTHVYACVRDAVITHAAPKKCQKWEWSENCSARWLRETKERNKSLRATYLKIKLLLCRVQDRGFKAQSHERIYKRKQRRCFWGNISLDMTVKLECEVWLRYETRRRRAERSRRSHEEKEVRSPPPLKLHEQISVQMRCAHWLRVSNIAKTYTIKDRKK